MKRSFKIITFILSLIIILAAFAVPSAATVHVDMEAYKRGHMELEVKENVTERGTQYDIDVRISSFYTLSFYELSMDGFNLCSEVNFDNYHASIDDFTIIYDGETKFPTMTLTAYMSNGSVLEETVYGVFMNGVIVVDGDASSHAGVVKSYCADLMADGREGEAIRVILSFGWWILLCLLIVTLIIALLLAAIKLICQSFVKGRAREPKYTYER